ncbi:MAG: hypothetical protein H8E45_02360 [Proteobacteria bacterium]|nr:hypothetical protein [Pseudomonadota bacterium]
MDDQFSDGDSQLSTAHEPAPQSPVAILRWSGFVLGLVAVVAAVAALMPSNGELQLRAEESALVNAEEFMEAAAQAEVIQHTLAMAGMSSLLKVRR